MPHVNHPHPIRDAIQAALLDEESKLWEAGAIANVEALIAAEGDNAETLMEEWWPGETIQDATYKQIADTIRNYLDKKKEETTA